MDKFCISVCHHPFDLMLFRVYKESVSFSECMNCCAVVMTSFSFFSSSSSSFGRFKPFSYVVVCCFLLFVFVCFLILWCFFMDGSLYCTVQFSTRLYLLMPYSSRLSDWQSYHKLFICTHSLNKCMTIKCFHFGIFSCLSCHYFTKPFILFVTFYDFTFQEHSQEI